MDIPRRLMVVGANSGNLGMAVIEEAMRSRVWSRVQGFDINGTVQGFDHPRYFDVHDRHRVITEIEDLSATDIVCTVGTNYPENSLGLLEASIRHHTRTNVEGPMLLLQEAIDFWTRWAAQDQTPETGFNFCVVSSNSAHIARSQSAGYCASKAALSMAVRCVARRVAGDMDIKIWGYEPGFITDTPMSQKTAEQFPDVPLHRIPSGEGIPRAEIADRIVADLINAQLSMNGCMIRIDGGEQ